MRCSGRAGFFSYLLLCAACGSNEPHCTPLTLPPATDSPDARADYLLSHMTLEEKLHLVHGAASANWPIEPQPRGAQGHIPELDCLSIPALYYADGSVGLRDSVGPATALPSSIASAAGWDLELAAKYGRVIGAESRAYGINVNLGGNVNLSGREPRGGRTFETKGEDPTLAGRINAAHVKAIQGEHVIAGVKHFAFNDQETGRGTANALVDERSARETDLLAFEISIKESDVQSVMCSYNLVNGEHSCGNRWLLSDVLKSDWAFPGFVMTDWDATYDAVNAANNGLDQEQPDSNHFGTLQSAIATGSVSATRLDDMVHRILRALFRVGLFDNPLSPQPIDAAAGAAVAQEVEEQGAVLLKNSGILPFKREFASIALIGSHADIGVLSGAGSAQVSPVGRAALVEVPPWENAWLRVVWDPSSPLQAIAAKVPGARVTFDDGSDVARAAALAASCDVALVFVNQWEGESVDLPSLASTDIGHAPARDQDALVSAVATANANAVVVLENGGAQFMPWLPNVAAVLEAWYPGQRGGEAIANILFGDVNPSGKLPLTFPAQTSDLPRPKIDRPSAPSAVFPVDYTIEGVNVGYKWYESKGFTPLFPFGFGLSYTTFEWTDPQLALSGTETSPDFTVTATLRNTGARTGAEVLQVYLRLPESTGEAKRLVGWQKVALDAGQAQQVSIPIRVNDSSHPLSYWDAESHGWREASGEYSVYLGNSSADVTLIGTFDIP